MTRDLRSSEPQTLRRMFENIGPRAWAGIFQNSWRGAAAEADAIGEQKLKRTLAGSSSRSGHNRGAAVEA